MSAEADGYKLFVGNLPADCTSEELRAVFSTYGTVTHVHVMNPHPRTGQRCAFVFYATRQAGDDACEVLDNQYKIRSDASQPIVVRWSKDSTGNERREKGPPQDGRAEDGYKLFVGSLPPDCTSEELRAVFSTYGTVTHVHVMNPHPRSGQRCAFVFYTTKAAGDDACKVLDNQYKIRSDASQPIVVRWSKEPREMRPKDGFEKGAHWEKGSPQEKGWGKGWEDDGWDWEWMGQSKGSKGSKGNWQGDGWSKGWSFREDGKGKAAKGPPPSYGKGWSKGYDSYGGYNHYDGYEDPRWDWEWMGQSKGSKGSKGNWQGDGWSKGWSFREDGKGKAAKGPPPSYGKGWSKGYDSYEAFDENGLDATGTKLYVANLPEDIQESALEYVFGTYGTVEKVHVMRGKAKNGCISGFVEFEKPDEATTAIMSLDNKYEIRAGYGPLQVRLANATKKY
eukprot:symbB.v1.2.004876.t1/scaffold264.1/size247971/17